MSLHKLKLGQSFAITSLKMLASLTNHVQIWGVQSLGAITTSQIRSCPNHPIRNVPQQLLWVKTSKQSQFWKEGPVQGLSKLELSLLSIIQVFKKYIGNCGCVCNWCDKSAIVLLTTCGFKKHFWWFTAKGYLISGRPKAAAPSQYDQYDSRTAWAFLFVAREGLSCLVVCSSVLERAGLSTHCTNRRKWVPFRSQIIFVWQFLVPFSNF